MGLLKVDAHEGGQRFRESEPWRKENYNVEQEKRKSKFGMKRKLAEKEVEPFKIWTLTGLKKSWQDEHMSDRIPSEYSE